MNSPAEIDATCPTTGTKSRLPRAALEERTRDRAPLQWAATQNNLGTVLQTLGERENGTGKLTEAVAAYREALKEWTQGAAPHWHDIAQQNMDRCLALLGQRRNP